MPPRPATISSPQICDYPLAVTFDTASRATIHQQPHLPATLRRAAAARLRTLADELDSTSQ